MRIAYVGNDLYSNCAMALLDEGHAISHLFSPRSVGLPAPVTIEDVSRRAGVRIRRERIERRDIERVAAEGAEALFCAAYPWRLPLGQGDALRAVNMHPAPLPEGRGPAPYEWAILTGRTDSAVSIHQVVERFDAGPILWQSSFALGPKETVASLEYRCREVAATGAVAVFRDFDQLWALRREQGPGTYCRLPRRRDRTLDWTETTEMLDRKLRAFSPGRRFARLAKREATIGEAQCWQQAHEHAPGAVVASRRNRHVVATADGFAFVESVGGDIEERLRRAAWPALSRARRLLRR